MNIGPNPSPEQFLEEIRKTQVEISLMRDEAWKTAEIEIRKLIESDGSLTESVEDAYLKVLKGIWNKGYATGAGDMSTYMARKLGAGEILDLMEKYKKVLKVKPENN